MTYLCLSPEKLICGDLRQCIEYICCCMRRPTSWLFVSVGLHLRCIYKSLQYVMCWTSFKDISTKITGMGIQSMENFQIECKLSKSWNMPVFRTYFRPNQKFYSIFLNFRDHQEIAMSSVVSKQWKGLSWNLRGKEEVWYDLPLIAKWKEMREITTTLSFAVLFEKCKTSSSNQKVKKHY